MRVHLVDDSPPILLLGGLLRAAGNTVTCPVAIPRLRLRLASGWHVATLRPPEPGEPPAEVMLGALSGELTLRLRSGGADDWELAPTPAGDGLLLFDVLRDADHVEALERSPILTLPRSAPLRRLFLQLRRFGFRIEEARETDSQLVSLLLTRLLDLPAALCDTTVEAFLATEEGRRIALAVLEEGRAVAEKLGPPPARIGWRDPTELEAKLKHRPGELDAALYAPDRRQSPVLHALRSGAAASVAPSQKGLVRRAATENVPVIWNWKILGVLGRVARAGPYRSPLELLRAVA